MRVALGVEYDGGQFHGWQRQPGLRTVQTAVEQALSKVANEPISVFCAGRTDTGVHASTQVVHFDTTVTRSERSWLYGVNSNLPKDANICWARVVSDSFHARYSAQARRYCYVIYNNPVRNSLFESHLTWQYRALDEGLMAKAAQSLLGKHDFSSFRAIHCQAKSPVRTVERFTVKRSGQFVLLDITANAFLHHMVRNIAGALIAIGSGRRDVAWIDELLAAKNRAVGAETAPPYGLYLVDIKYPEEYDLPQRQALPFFLGPFNDTNAD